MAVTFAYRLIGLPVLLAVGTAGLGLAADTPRPAACPFPRRAVTSAWPAVCRLVCCLAGTHLSSCLSISLARSSLRSWSMRSHSVGDRPPQRTWVSRSVWGQVASAPARLHCTALLRTGQLARVLLRVVAVPPVTLAIPVHVELLDDFVRLRHRPPRPSSPFPCTVTPHQRRVAHWAGLPDGAPTLMSEPVTLAPWRRGRSVHVLAVCVIAPQFSHAPLRNLVTFWSCEVARRRNTRLRVRRARARWWPLSRALELAPGLPRAASAGRTTT